MRIHSVVIALGVASATMLSLAPEPARACDPYAFYGGPMYYRPMRAYSVQPTYAPPMYSRPAAPGYSAVRPTTTVSVAAYDNYFQPNTITVQPGTTVRFVNAGRHTHTVSSNDRRFDSGDLPPGATYTVTFTNPGTFYYFCRHHTREKMQGTIVVGGATGGGTSAAPGY
jgi:plastocyanin